MKIGVVGSGEVAQTLAAGFLKHGHEVMIGSRSVSKLETWAAGHAGAKVGSFADAASFGDLIVLSVKGTAAIEALRLAGADSLNGKVVVDTTNPIADLPPQDGVLAFFTGPNESLMESLQLEFPGARFVKAFNSVGLGRMVDPPFETRPSMFICGNDDAAKTVASDLLDQFGWETIDMGKAAAARAIEPLCMPLVHPRISAKRVDPRLQTPTIVSFGKIKGYAGTKDLSPHLLLTHYHLRGLCNRYLTVPHRRVGYRTILMKSDGLIAIVAICFGIGLVIWAGWQVHIGKVYFKSSTFDLGPGIPYLLGETGIGFYIAIKGVRSLQWGTWPPPPM